MECGGWCLTYCSPFWLCTEAHPARAATCQALAYPLAARHHECPLSCASVHFRLSAGRVHLHNLSCSKMTVAMMILSGCVHSTALCRSPMCIFSCIGPDILPSAPPSMPAPSTLKRPLLLSKRTGLGLGSPLGPVKNYLHAKQLPVAHRPSVFQSPDDDDDEEEDYEQWLEIKGKL